MAKSKSPSRLKAIGGGIVLALVVIYGLREASRTPSRVGNTDGELIPHHEEPLFHYVSSYGRDHVYVRPSETVRLQDGVLVADVFIVTEEFAKIARNRSTNKIAVVPDLAAVDALNDSAFITAPSNTLLDKAIEVYVSQRSANGETRSGTTREWLYVGVAPDLHTVYVSTGKGGQERNGLEIIPMLSVKEQRCQLYIDSRNELFAPVNTDLMGTPQQEIIYQPIRDGQLEDKVWKIVREVSSP